MKLRKNTLLIYFINSFSYILLAFFTVFVLSRLVMAGAGLIFDIPSTLFKHELEFSAQEEDWWFDSVTAVFFSRVISYLVFGLISYIIYLKSVPYNGYLKLYFIWVSFFSIIMLFGEVFFGNILKEGVYHALAWLYVSDTFRLIMIVVLLLLYLLASVLFSKGFVTSANIYFSSFNEYRLKVFFLYQLFFPYFTGVLALTLIMLPEFPMILMLSLYSGIIVMIIILFQTGNHAQYMKTEEEPKELMFDSKAFLTALFLMIFYVVILTNGVTFT